jgi:hypothetical protein
MLSRAWRFLHAWFHRTRRLWYLAAVVLFRGVVCKADHGLVGSWSSSTGTRMDGVGLIGSKTRAVTPFLR